MTPSRAPHTLTQPCAGTTKQNQALAQAMRSLAKGDHGPLGPGHPLSGSLTQPMPSHTLTLSLPVLFLVSGNSQANLQVSSATGEQEEKVTKKCDCRLGELNLCPAEASTNAVFRQTVLAGELSLYLAFSGPKRVSQPPVSPHLFTALRELFSEGLRSATERH